ncbi:DNA replication and repair protein RecF [Striga asiatica]|uniref:DNA replication and repair protein RecF n=1 Tax=Striga asiatica TaxID=4170 RepID=A0A5A7PZR4_STRAF|nr:DNA replication and repair protein RecF [Striga asiatica]
MSKSFSSRKLQILKSVAEFRFNERIRAKEPIDAWRRTGGFLSQLTGQFEILGNLQKSFRLAKPPTSSFKKEREVLKILVWKSAIMSSPRTTSLRIRLGGIEICR